MLRTRSYVQQSKYHPQLLRCCLSTNKYFLNDSRVLQFDASPERLRSMQRVVMRERGNLSMKRRTQQALPCTSVRRSQVGLLPQEIIQTETSAKYCCLKHILHYVQMQKICITSYLVAWANDLQNECQQMCKVATRCNNTI